MHWLLASTLLLFACGDDSASDGSDAPGGDSPPATSRGPGDSPADPGRDDGPAAPGDDRPSDADTTTAGGAAPADTGDDTEPDTGNDGDGDGDDTGNDSGNDSGNADTPPSDGSCVAATLLWFEDFEGGGYENFTGNTYGEDWGDACQSTARSMDRAVSGSWSQRSEVVCPYSGGSHRGYGGVQFDGDTALPRFTNSGAGTDAPFGLVNTFWMYLETDTVFQGGRWFSPLTVSGSCDWSDRVLTLGIESPDGRIAAAHYNANGGGERTFEPNAPALPRDQWVRITLYVNYHDNVMHVWQDGQSQSHVTFDRQLTTICHWHWGLYASGDNDDIVLYEDDNAIWKLDEAWTDFGTEPYLGEAMPVCD